LDYVLETAWPNMMNKTFKKRGLMSMFRSTWPLLVAAGIALSAVSSAHAADALSVDLDGARILKLDSPASDIIIGNPNIADVTVQTPNRLVVIGRAPGVTRLIVMSDGAITMDTQVVVTAKNPSAQVSVLAPDGNNITETEFACSDRCTVVPGTKRTAGGAGGSAGAGGGGDGSIPTEPTVDQIPPPSPGGGGNTGVGDDPSY
jgi:Flp pilus assembly secretin CpaC